MHYFVCPYRWKQKQVSAAAEATAESHRITPRNKLLEGVRGSHRQSCIEREAVLQCQKFASLTLIVT